MESSRVQAAEMSDVEELADLWVALAESQRAHDSHIRPTENRDRVRELIASTIVADGIRVVREPHIVGFVMYSLDTGSFEQDVRRGVVQNLYVVESRRGEGIGSALLAAAEANLANAGAEVISLEAMADNSGARRFYDVHGYRPHRVEYEKPVESDTNSKGDR